MYASKKARISNYWKYYIGQSKGLTRMKVYNQKLNIENELYVGEGEFHEYWGALNGNWLGSPNDNYTQIISDSYNFLYNQLDSFELGDVNNDGVLNVLDIVLIINLILVNDYNLTADVNEDGSVNILDVVIMTNILVGGLP